MTFWDRFAPLYDLAEQTSRQTIQAMVREILRRVPPGGTFLECAAGTGEISLAVSSQARRVLCTDLSLPMLDRAKAKALRQGRSNIEFAWRDLLSLPEPDGAFDAVCAANVLHLLEDPSAAVRELWRVTAPGGVLLLPTFLTAGVKLPAQVLLGAYRLLGFRPRRAFSAESYRTFFQNLLLPEGECFTISGRIPIGIFVLQKEYPCVPSKEESL